MKYSNLFEPPHSAQIFNTVARIIISNIFATSVTPGWAIIRKKLYLFGLRWRFDTVGMSVLVKKTSGAVITKTEVVFYF